MVMRMDSVNPQKHRLRRPLTLAFKLLIAVVGLWYVISQMSWHDRVFIEAGTKIRRVTVLENASVRVLGWRHGMPQVKLASQKITVRLTSGRVVTGMANRQPIGLPTTVTLPVGDLVHAHGQLEISRGLIDLIRSARPWPLLAALLLMALPTFITSWRWRKLLAVQELRLSYGKCLTLTFVGQFYSTFLPGSVSGDVVKVIYTGRITAQPTKVAVTVLLDRVLGLIALMMVALLAITALLLLDIIRPGGGWTSLDPLVIHIFLVIGVALLLACTGAILYFDRPLRHRLGMDALLERLPLPEFIKHADQSLQVYRGYIPLMGFLVVVSMFSQSVLPVVAWLLGQAFAMHVPFATFMVYIPVVALAVSLPIVPPSGLGVLDALLLYFFVTHGADSANQAFALAQGLRFLPLLWTIIGAYWVVRGKFPRPIATQWSTATQT